MNKPGKPTEHATPESPRRLPAAFPVRLCIFAHFALIAPPTARNFVFSGVCVRSFETGKRVESKKISSGSFGITKPFTNLMKAGGWLCPSAPRHDFFPYQDHDFSGYGYIIRGVYWDSEHTNALGPCGHLVQEASYIPGFPSFTPIQESEVTSPVEMMAIGDSLFSAPTFDRWDMLSPTRIGRATALHQGRVNVLFCDGHVESPTLQVVFGDTNDTALVRWNRDHQPHRDKL